MARPERVASEFRAGATIVLQGLHLHWRPAALYCRALEAALGCPVQANAYFTPASARGFAVHHDTHDVLVLQVAGTKRWLWYEPVLELPLGEQRFSAERDDPGDPVADLALAPGDTLYLPRGWPHEARTSDSDSLHLTIGLHPPSRLDAIRAALAECADDVEFRRTLDADGALPAGLLDRLAERLEPELVRARARRRLVARRRPILDRHLAELEAAERLRAGDAVERRPTVLHVLELERARPALLFEGREIAVPARAGDALAAAAATDAPFCAADLPGPIDEAGRLVLVRRLVREGFLRIAAGPE
ncbi:MAG TPA: cupin domain-containing protein [Solirubrobacterales bacterium]